jgi:hypothetical protein
LAYRVVCPGRLITSNNVGVDEGDDDESESDFCSDDGDDEDDDEDEAAANVDSRFSALRLSEDEDDDESMVETKALLFEDQVRKFARIKPVRFGLKYAE